MRLIKMLGLAMVAALAAMAFVGAGTASATTLCAKAEVKCAAPLAKGTALKGELKEGKAVLKSGFVTVECSKSTVEGKTTSAGGGVGTNVTGEVTEATWTECTSPLGACTTKSLNKPWVTEIAWTEKNDGTLTVFNPRAEFTCAGTRCEYGAGEVTLAVTGGAPATVVANAVGLTKTGGSIFCSATATWSATYKVTTPNPLFVSKE